MQLHVRQNPRAGLPLVSVWALGSFQVRVRGVLRPPPPRRAARLFKYLLCSGGHSVGRDRLAASLWPDDANAIGSLHIAVHEVREWLGEMSVLRFEASEYRLVLCQLDADLFESQIVQARRLRATRPAEALEKYHIALSLYAGPLLGDEGDTDWVTYRRGELEQEFMEAAIFLAGDSLERSDVWRALELADRVCRLDPAREDAVRIQMQALAVLGRRSEALRCYARLQAFTRQEFDCDPDPATVAVRASLLIAPR